MSKESMALNTRDLLTAQTELLEEEVSAEISELQNLFGGVPPQSYARAFRYRRRRSASSPTTVIRPGEVGRCRTLEPVFAVASEDVSTAAGNLETTFARVDAGHETLEVAATTGDIGGERYAPASSFILDYNRASASIGYSVSIPEHSAGAVLEVTASLQVWNIWNQTENGTAKGPAGSLVWVVPGQPALPLRGPAAAWCRAGLNLWGAGGSQSGVSTEFVSEWVSGDGDGEQRDLTQNGAFELSHSVALDPQLAVAGIFVSTTCFAAAEGEHRGGDKVIPPGGARFQCRRDAGPYPQPSFLQVASIDVRLCEVGARLPVLLAGPPATARVS